MGRNIFIRQIVIILKMRIQSIHYGIVSAIVLTAVLSIGTTASTYAQNLTNAQSSGLIKGALTSLQNDAADNSTH
jgi:hypothetical protein